MAQTPLLIVTINSLNYIHTIQVPPMWILLTWIHMFLRILTVNQKIHTMFQNLHTLEINRKISNKWYVNSKRGRRNLRNKGKKEENSKLKKKNFSQWRNVVYAFRTQRTVSALHACICAAAFNVEKTLNYVLYAVPKWFPKKYTIDLIHIWYII